MEKIESILITVLKNKNIAKYCVMPFVDIRDVYAETNEKRLNVCLELKQHQSCFSVYTERISMPWSENYFIVAWRSHYFNEVCKNCHKYRQRRFFNPFDPKLCNNCDKFPYNFEVNENGTIN
jgi:hypothetical protein